MRHVTGVIYEYNSQPVKRGRESSNTLEWSKSSVVSVVVSSSDLNFEVLSALGSPVVAFGPAVPDSIAQLTPACNLNGATGVAHRPCSWYQNLQ